MPFRATFPSPWRRWRLPFVIPVQSRHCINQSALGIVNNGRGCIPIAFLNVLDNKLIECIDGCIVWMRFWNDHPAWREKRKGGNYRKRTWESTMNTRLSRKFGIVGSQFWHRLIAKKQYLGFHIDGFGVEFVSCVWQRCTPMVHDFTSSRWCYLRMVRDC